MYKELLPVDWSFMSEEEDVQARWGTFINKHDEMVEKYVPVGLSSGGGLPKNKWMNNRA